MKIRLFFRLKKSINSNAYSYLKFLEILFKSSKLKKIILYLSNIGYILHKIFLFLNLGIKFFSIASFKGYSSSKSSSKISLSNCVSPSSFISLSSSCSCFPSLSIKISFFCEPNVISIFIE